MKTAEQVVQLLRERQKYYGPMREQMREMCSLYNGDIAVPLPEMRRDEKPAVVNLAKQGINQLGMRAASVMPNMAFPPINTGRRDDAEARADKRRKVAMSWWDDDSMNLKLRQRGRWLFAYAHAPSLVMPNFKEGRPTYRPITPLDCYPAPLCAFDDMVPYDCIISTMHTAKYVRDNYDTNSVQMALKDVKDDQLVEVVLFIDPDEVHTVVTPRLANDQIRANYSGQSIRAATLDQAPNLTGRSWVVLARTIGLEGPSSNFTGLVGIYQAQAELEAMSRIARRKGVFWEEWLIADTAGGIPQVLVQADPYNGQVGIIQGGKIDRFTPESQYATDTGVDRFERSMRVEAGLPSDFGGESSTNVRTGARASALIQSAVDPLLQEAHEIFARSLRAENEIAIAIDKAYYSGRRKTVWLGFEAVEYDPGTIWETDRHTVDYALAGADMNQMTIVPLQMVGAQVMSRETAMGLHPLIKDVEMEMDRIVVDRLENAALTGTEQMIAQPGGMDLMDVIAIARLVKTGEMDFLDAANKVHQDRQAKEAQMAQMQQANDPNAQPGLNTPGAPPAIAAPSDAMSNLRNVLGNLRMQQRTTPPERGVPQGA